MSFEELEMEDLRGSVGFRCPIKSVIEDENGVQEVIQDGVNVTPSRESVIWDDDTKSYIKKVITHAKEEAESIITQSIKNMDNPFEWYDLINSAQNNTSSGKLGQLAGIVNVKELDLRFKGTKLTKSKVHSLMSNMVRIKRLRYQSWTDQLINEETNTSDWFNSLNSHNNRCYYKTTSNRYTSKDEYLSSLNNRQSVLIAQLMGVTEFKERIEAVWTKDFGTDKAKLTELQTDAVSTLRVLAEIHGLKLNKLPIGTQFKSKSDLDEFLLEVEDKYQETYDQLYDYLGIEEYSIQDYVEIEVPKDEQERIEKIEEARKEEEKKKAMSREEIRQQNNEMVIHYPKVVNDSSTFFQNKIVFSAYDTKISSLDKVNGKTRVLYGYSEHRTELEFYADHFLTKNKDFNNDYKGMASAFSKLENDVAYYRGPEMIVLMVSKKNGKLFRTLDNFVFIEDFELVRGHLDDNEEVLTTSPELMSRFTRKYIFQRLQRRDYPALMKVMKEINPTVADLYTELEQYSSKAANFTGSDLVPYSAMNSLFEAMIEVQIKLHDNPNEKVGDLELSNMKITDLEQPFVLDPNMLAKIRIFESIFDEDEDTTHYLTILGYYFLKQFKDLGSDNIALQKAQDAFINAGLNEFDIDSQLAAIKTVNLQIK